MKFVHLMVMLWMGAMVFGCGDTQPTKTETPAPEPAEAPTTEKTIKKAPVTITPSDERDYPELVRDLGFPIHPKAEVANVGNALLDGDGLFMRLNIEDTIENTVTYYGKEMQDLGWQKEELNIFQGADKAMRFIKDGVVCRLIMIEESDYTKVAVQMTRQIDPSEFEDR